MVIEVLSVVDNSYVIILHDCKLIYYFSYRNAIQYVCALAIKTDVSINNNQIGK